MKIVGVGCGPGMLTKEAIDVIEQATKIYGSKRAIDLVREYTSPSCQVSVIEDYKRLSELPGDAVILSTGDPMLAGLGNLPGEIIPGISSLQVAAARLRFGLDRVAVVVVHGRDRETGILETIDEVRRGKIVFLIADPKFDVTEFYRRLGIAGFTGPVRIAVCENLGYPEERIVSGDLLAPPRPLSGLYSLVIGAF